MIYQYRKISIVLALFIFFEIISHVLFPVKSAQAWVNGWGYRRPFTVTGSSGTQTYYPVLLDPSIYDNTGLTGSWHFSEGSGTTTVDMSGNRNSGTITGATWTTGRFGNAPLFDATNEYVSLGTTAGNFGTGDFSVEFWFKGSEVGGWRWLCQKGGNGANAILITTNGNGFRVSMGSWFTDVISGTTITVDNTSWYHVVLTRSGTSVKFYVNGSQNGNTGTRSANISNSSPLYLARGPAGEAGFTSGIIDEFKIYSRALSASEISDHYNNGTPKVRHDYADIRFTNSSDQLLDYWQQTDSRFWVNVDSIPASPGTATIYEYYGNSGAGNYVGSNTTIGTTSGNPGTTCLQIKDCNPSAASGTYYLRPASTTFQAYCDMSTSGAVWTKLNSNYASIAVNKGSAAWSGDNIAGTGYGTNCGVNQRAYTLTASNISYTNLYVLLTRTTSILQCSNISQTDGGWYTPPYVGTFTSVSMCNWGDAVWANACCSAENMTNLKLNWAMVKTGENSSLFFNQDCATPDQGAFTMQWFVSRNGNMTTDPSVGTAGAEQVPTFPGATFQGFVKFLGSVLIK